MNISKAIDQVQFESEQNILLCIQELVSEDKLKEVEYKGISKTKKLFVTGRHYNDIPKNIEFNVIFDYDYPQSYISLKTKIINFSMRKNQYLDILPEGYGGGVLIDFFNKETPEIIDVLKREKGKYKALYLTNQPVMDRIIELLNE